MATPEPDAHNAKEKKPQTGESAEDEMSHLNGGMFDDVFEMAEAASHNGRSVAGMRETLTTCGVGSRLSASSAKTPVMESTCGIVATRVAHDFGQPGSKWLHVKDLQLQLGRAPGPLERPAVLNALSFRCNSRSCPEQNCSAQMDEVNVVQLRQKWASECIAGGYMGPDQREPVKKTLMAAYNRDSGARASFKEVPVMIMNRRGEMVQINLCVSTWAVTVASMGWGTFTKLRSEIPKLVEMAVQLQPTLGVLCFNDTFTSTRQFKGSDKQSAADKPSNDSTIRLVTSYLRDHLKTLEHNPTPGACRTVEYIAPKETWDTRVDSARKYFAAKGIHVSIDRQMLSKAWRSLAYLVERAMKSHAKCDLCALIDAQLCSLIGKHDPISIGIRIQLRCDKQLHREMIAFERGELDDAGYRSIVYPELQMSLIGDGATQRNFLLPKLRKRAPKELATKSLFASKLYGVFLYGFGMNCYLVHESVGGGSNLTCTAIYLTIQDAVRAGRPLPEELHISLDNTTGENKCVTVICFAGWLVKNKWVTCVRIFFLMKGHTHVIIDQAFGSITKFIRSRSVLSVPQLLSGIRQVISRSRRYLGQEVKELHHLYDFKTYFQDAEYNLGGFASNTFAGDGYHDMMVTLNDDGDAVLNVKKWAATPEYTPEAEGGFHIFRPGAFDKLPETVPIAHIKGDAVWDRIDFQSTLSSFEQYYCSTQEEIEKVRGEWKETLRNTARCDSSLLPENIIPFSRLHHASPAERAITKPAVLYNLRVDVANPPVCPIHGGGRTLADVKKQAEAWLVEQRGDFPAATTPLATNGLYAPDFLLYNDGSDVPKLAAIQGRVQRHLPPTSRAVEVRCVRYTTAEETETDIYGPYSRCSGADSIVILSRSQIIVYNVRFLKGKEVKNKSFLSRNTFDALSDVWPAFVDRVKEKEPAVYVQSAAATRPPRPKRVSRVAIDTRDSSDEESHDEDEEKNDEDEEDEMEIAEDDEAEVEHPRMTEEGNEGDKEPAGTTGAAPQAEEADEFALRGLRKKGDFVWIDLEGVESVRKLKYPIGLARCEEDEVDGKVTCSWYDAVSWKSPGANELSVRNATYGMYWTKQDIEDDEGNTSTKWEKVCNAIKVDEIIPVRVEIAKEHRERVTVAPDAVKAVVKWLKAHNIRKQKAPAGGSNDLPRKRRAR